MNIRELGEFGFIDILRKMCKKKEGVLGIGDDCAIIKGEKKDFLLTTDVLVEDVHFVKSLNPPHKLGRKCMAVNVSDIAAMGGMPLYALVSMCIPKNIEQNYLQCIVEGIIEEAEKFSIHIIGGDTSCSEKLMISIMVIGETEKGKVILRSGAKVGDRIYITGCIGGSYVGLLLLKKGIDDKIIDKHLIPEARVDIGRKLIDVATSMIDVSDGIISDVLHICEESKVGMHVYIEKIPLCAEPGRWGLKTIDLLTGGEDYELLFTAPPDQYEHIHTISSSMGIPITMIGEITEKGIEFSEEGQRLNIAHKGYNHFRE